MLATNGAQKIDPTYIPNMLGFFHKEDGKYMIVLSIRCK
jgi:hypothetical protein